MRCASTNEGKTRTRTHNDSSNNTSAQVLFTILEVTIHMPTPFCHHLNTYERVACFDVFACSMQILCKHTADIEPYAIRRTLN